MLVPVRTSGTKPPLYFVHGLMGFVSIGGFLAQALGQDQPFYCVNANSIDSRATTKTGSVKAMALNYVEEILRVQPSGPLVIGGMCVGGLAAIEVARELQARGREVGPVILADPPTVPPGYIKQNQTVNGSQHNCMSGCVVSCWNVRRYPTRIYRSSPTIQTRCTSQRWPA
jgi:thioesterase domain-containing protein